jgi:hypothetical protein
MSSTQALPAEAPDPSHGVIRLVRLKREGVGRGDLVATRRLGTCEVVSIASPHSLTVRALDNHTHYRISGIDFGTGAPACAKSPRTRPKPHSTPRDHCPSGAGVPSSIKRSTP